MAGIVNIEWIDNTKGAVVSLKGSPFFVDVLPKSFADEAFQKMATTTTSADSDAAPTGTTHALISGQSGNHYIRKGVTPLVTTGGMYLAAGASRLIPIEAGAVFKIVSTA